MNQKNQPDLFFSGIVGKKLTSHAQNCLQQSFYLTRKIKPEKIGNLHLFYSIFMEKGSLGSIILKDLGIKKEFFKDYFQNSTDIFDKKTDREPIQSEMFSELFKKTFLRACSIAKNLNCGYVGTEHFVYALLESDDKEIKNILARTKAKKIPIPQKNIRRESGLLSLNELMKEFFPPLDFDFHSGAPLIQDNLMGLFSAPKDVKTKTIAPFISRFCVDINKKVNQQKEIFIGRQKEIEKMVSALGRKNKNNPLLIGHPGVGKTALIFALAKLINSKNIPPFLFGKKIMSLDVASLVAGTSFRGEFESRLKEIIREASENKNIILFIDEIHNIVGAGNIAGSLDLANIIKPALSQGDIRIIGATTFAEYKKSIEKDAALDRRFQLIQIKEPSMEETKKIILGIKEHYEAFHNVSISSKMAGLAAELSGRYIKNRYFPDKAIDILDEAASCVRSRGKLSDLEIKIQELEDKKKDLEKEKERMISEENYEQAIQLRNIEKQLEEEMKLLKKQQSDLHKKETRVEIAPEDIFQTVARLSGVAEEKLSQTKNEKIRNINKILSSRVIGQNEVIKKIAGALWRSQSGIGSTERPLGSFLFMGPTGVGKTLTAQILAQEFFSDSGAFIRIDMSEFMERHSVSALIGSPAGYIGYGEGGRLTEKVRRNPYAVVLFDEIEKAHNDVANILLQILEDGTLTDAEGLKVDFKNTIIILTTNLGTEDFTDTSRIGFGSEKFSSVAKKFQGIRENALKELEKRMKPELLNRLDNILVFHPLDKKEIEKITSLETEKLQKRLEKQNINLSLTKTVLNFITKKSFSPKHGARLIRKNIREMLEDPIAEMIVHDKVKNDKIMASVKKGRLLLT